MRTPSNLPPGTTDQMIEDFQDVDCGDYVSITPEEYNAQGYIWDEALFAARENEMSDKGVTGEFTEWARRFEFQVGAGEWAYEKPAPSKMEFGDYVLIEQKRYGVPNEMYLYKVIGTLQSNMWVDVPVQIPETETRHDEMAQIVSCICCGVREREVRYYREVDVTVQKGKG